jgi:hypothetical protein
MDGGGGGNGAVGVGKCAVGVGKGAVGAGDRVGRGFMGREVEAGRFPA